MGHFWHCGASGGAVREGTPASSSTECSGNCWGNATRELPWQLGQTIHDARYGKGVSVGTDVELAREEDVPGELATADLAGPGGKPEGSM